LVAAEVRMTVQEYLELMGKLAEQGVIVAENVKTIRREGKKLLKRKGKPDPKMARALKKANALGRKKSGGFKKGYSQARIMKKAHQLRRKM
jgi:hypothetical protein